MSNKNFDIYFEFNYSSFNIAAFNKSNEKLEHYKEKTYESYFNDLKELNFNKFEKLIEENVFDLERSTKDFVKDVHLIIETPQSTTLSLSVSKKNEGNELNKDDIMYLIQDAKQQILKSNQDFEIIHIIVDNYVLDNVKYELFPTDKKCDQLSIDLKFICFPKDLLKNFEKLFLKQQISISKFICLNYIKTLNLISNYENICELGKYVVNGINKQEVVFVPKNPKRKGFFEKLFHFFN